MLYSILYVIVLFPSHIVGKLRIPCVGHLVHNVISKAFEDDQIKTLLALSLKIVALFHASCMYLAKLKKAQLNNDVITRWGLNIPC